MSKQPISQKRAQRQQQENLALQKIFNVFLWGLAAECYLFFVYRGYYAGGVDAFLTWGYILEALIYVGLGAAAVTGGLAWWKRDNTKLRNGLIAGCGVGLFLGVTSLLAILFDPDVVGKMCIAVPILTLLGLVYFLFQFECFLATVSLSGALFAVWVIANGLGSGWRLYVMAGAVASIAVLAALGLLSAKAAKNGGAVKGLRLFSADCDYRVLYAVFAVGAAAILAALLVSSAAYYLLWVLGVALFAVMVYYTTKLM